MKTLKIFAIIFTLILSFTACSKSTVQQDWQEQFDLGIRFLNEDNYEEAIIAFEAAIKIDPKNPEAYIGLADVYIEKGDPDKAKEILEKGLEEIPDNEKIIEKFKILGVEVVDGTIAPDSTINVSVDTPNDDGPLGAVKDAIYKKDNWDNSKKMVKITGLSFNKESFLAGEDTEFDVEVTYAAPKNVTNCSIKLLHPGDLELDNAENKSVINESTGVCEYSFSAVPIKSDNNDYMVIALLTSSEEVLSEDILHITADGEMVDYNTENEVVAFEHYIGYRDYNTLSEEDQQNIAKIGNTIIPGDKNAIISLAEDDSLYNPMNLRTIWNGYKMELYKIENDDVKGFRVEMRPENGMGYIVNVLRNKNYDGDILSWEGSHRLQFSSCQCNGWIWNGEYNYESGTVYESAWNSEDWNIYKITGNVVNGLNDGKWVDGMPKYGEELLTTLIYENGVCVNATGIMNSEIEVANREGKYYMLDMTGNIHGDYYRNCIYW